VLHLRDLDRRIGAILGPGEWLAAGVSVGAAAAAAAVSVVVTHFTAGVAPIPLGLLGVGIFSVTYFALTIALRHPDAARLWKLVS
jgi:hypothetical protein